MSSSVAKGFAMRRDHYWGTPEGSRDFDRLSDMSLSFREKLEWLEEAEELSLRLSANRARTIAGDCLADSPDPQSRQPR